MRLSPLLATAAAWARPSRLALSRVAPWSALALLLASVAGAHLWLIDAFPRRRLFGDELMYSGVARKDAGTGVGSLLPGRLRMSHQPSLHPRVLSQIGPAADSEPARSRKSYRAALFMRARYFNVALSVLTLACVFAQARLLGAGPWLALLAPLLLALVPRVIFHIHALWSETLHMAFQSLFFAAMCAALRGGSRAWLVAAGTSLGLAVLTRATLLYFVPVAAMLAALYAFHAARGAPALRRAAASLASTGLLLVSLGAVIVPQYLANERAGWGYRLSTNTWRNLEYGLLRSAPGDPPGLGISDWDEANRRYHEVGKLPRLHSRRTLNRELHARQRTLEFVASLPLTTHVRRQWHKARAMLLDGRDTLHFAIDRRRWGADTAALAPLGELDRRYWQLLIGAGLLALPLLAWRSYGWALTGSFVVYYLLAFAAVPINARVAVQLAPALCLVAAAGLAHVTSWAWGKTRRRRAR